MGLQKARTTWILEVPHMYLFPVTTVTFRQDHSFPSTSQRLAECPFGADLTQNPTAKGTWEAVLIYPN